MRSALISSTAPCIVPSSSTTAVPYQVTSVSSMEMGSNTWMWLPKSEKLGKPQPEPYGDVVVVRGDLTLVPEIDTDCTEDVSHLQVEDGGIGVDQQMDA